MFRLSKWYLDLVTDDGAVLILYAARLQWLGVRINYSSVLQTRNGAGARDAATFRRVAPPRLEGDLLTWSCDRLAARGEWRRDAAPIESTLADGPDGLIRWTCHLPRARVSARVGSQTMQGLGYAEHLCVTVAPSRLPFRTLRWGRHLSERHALVWIEWDGIEKWIWLDGVRQPGVVDLRLWNTRELRDRRIAGLHEHKQVSRSAILRGGQPVDEGWAIHEVVTR